MVGTRHLSLCLVNKKGKKENDGTSALPLSSGALIADKKANNMYMHRVINRTKERSHFSVSFCHE